MISLFSYRQKRILSLWARGIDVCTIESRTMVGHQVCMYVVLQALSFVQNPIKSDMLTFQQNNSQKVYDKSAICNFMVWFTILELFWF